jgi:hypothetical protein
MVIKKPINWKYVQDIRYDDWKLMKGDFGEYFVKEYLESKGFELERLERRARKLPDFKIKGRPILIEVKSHKSKTKSRL